jgi:hypothetical protein
MTDQVVALPRGDAPQTSPGDRRAYVRQECNLNVFSQPGEGRLDHVWWPATVRNISPGGIGLVLSRPFEVGTLLAMELPSSTQSGGHKFFARVRHATPHRDGWLLGCAFVTKLSPEEIAALLP